MRKKILLFTLLTPLWCLGQRHLQGMKEVRFCGGVTKLGYYGDVGFGYNLKSNFSLGGDLNYESAKLSGLAISTGLLNVGIAYNPFHIKETVYFNILGGIAATYSTLGDVTGLKEGAKKSGLNLGGYLGAEMDVYLSDRFILTAHYKQFYLPLQYMGNALYLIGGGFKISLN